MFETISIDLVIPKIDVYDVTLVIREKTILYQSQN